MGNGNLTCPICGKKRASRRREHDELKLFFWPLVHLTPNTYCNWLHQRHPGDDEVKVGPGLDCHGEFLSYWYTFNRTRRFDCCRSGKTSSVCSIPYLVYTYVCWIFWIALKSRNTWPGNFCLASDKQQSCLFACSTSRPALFGAVSACHSHSRDQPNSSATMLPSKLTRQPKKMDVKPNSLYNNEQQVLVKRFPISTINNVFELSLRRRLLLCFHRK